MSKIEGEKELEALVEKQSAALQKANERAEAAEARIAELEESAPAEKAGVRERSEVARTDGSHDSAGVEELRKEPMMAHLLDSLGAGKDIGHYGRLVFAMVARHFLSDDEVLEYLTRDKDFSGQEARVMLRQVEGRDYNPPRRERILEWQSQQEFPILPNPADPDCGNVYRNLKFPEEIYKHIEEYQEEKLEAGE